jgi:hypothetical protein
MCLVGLLVLSLVSCRRAPEPDNGKAGAPKVNIPEKESETVLEPIPAPGPWETRLKLTTDGTMKLTMDVRFRTQDGQPSETQISLDPVVSGEISLGMVEGKADDGKPTSVLKLVIPGGETSTHVSFPALANRGTMHLPQRTVVKAGEPIVLALTAGKQAEAKKPNEGLEETARRSEWYAVVTLTFERKKDGYGIMLSAAGTPPGPDGCLRYTGLSLRGAIEGGKNVARPDEAKALAQAVKVDPANPKRGTIRLSQVYWWVGTQPHSSTGGSAVLTLERPDAETSAWELTAESREKVKELIGIP